MEDILTLRVRDALCHLNKVKEKKMFRGITFMLNDKMCVSTGSDTLMCRVDPILQEQILTQRPCEPMLMKGKICKGYFFVKSKDLDRQEDFDFWIDLAIAYNNKLATEKNQR